MALKKLGVLQSAPDTLARPVEFPDRLSSTPDKSTMFDGAVDTDTAGAYFLLALLALQPIFRMLLMQACCPRLQRCACTGQQAYKGS